MIADIDCPKVVEDFYIGANKNSPQDVFPWCTTMLPCCNVSASGTSD